jgi:hypothetical protein
MLIVGFPLDDPSRPGEDRRHGTGDYEYIERPAGGHGVKALAGQWPEAGRAGKATKVVVHGSGFLPVSSADEAQIVSGGKVLATVAASCSATKCTITVPAEATRTIDIKIFASSLWSSPLTAKDRYKYVK